MAQSLIRSFIAELALAVELPDPIVEFGSLQVESDQDADLRPLFEGRHFIGSDIRSGPGVDRIEDLRSLSFTDGQVGTALCLDTLEHCADPVTACRELHRVVADGGVCVLSSVMLFPIHDYPSDYWRFTPDGFSLLLRDFQFSWTVGLGDPRLPVQVVGVGAKRPLDLSLGRFPSLVHEQARWSTAGAGVRLGPLVYSSRVVARALVRQAPATLYRRLRRC